MPTTSVTIRDARPSDYPAIASLYREMLNKLASKDPAQYRPEGAVISLKEEMFVATLSDPDWTFLVAEVNSSVVGAIQLSIQHEEANEYRHAARCVWIEELVVAENQPLEAVVAVLMEAAETWTSQHDIQILDFIIYDFNDAMRAVAATRNYQVVSTRVRKTCA